MEIDIIQETEEMAKAIAQVVRRFEKTTGSYVVNLTSQSGGMKQCLAVTARQKNGTEITARAEP